MRVGVLCAGDREAAPFLPLIQDERITRKALLTFHEGTLHGISVVVLYGGVCKVNAGTAGGMTREVDIFDVVISTEVAYHDVAPHILTGFPPWMDSPFFAADPHLLALTKRAAQRLARSGKVFWGRMVTGEAVIADEGRAAIHQQFAPLSVDMESASIAHVCYANRIPFLSIRAVTDNEQHSGTGHFEENCGKAAVIAKDVTLALLGELAGEL